MTTLDASLPAVNAERIRRMRECWQGQAPSDLEVRQTLRRIERRAHGGGAGRRRYARIALATVALWIGCTVVHAAQGERDWSVARVWQVISQPFRSPEASPRIPTDAVSRLRVAQAPSVAPPPATTDEPAAVAPVAESEPEAEAESVPEREPSTERVASERRITRLAVHASLSVEVEVATEDDASRVATREAAWESRGVEGDDRGYVPSAMARDAAALSRAYLWIEDGRELRARPTLERLARSGASVGIRRRAFQLLLRVMDPSGSSLRKTTPTTLA